MRAKPIHYKQAAILLFGIVLAAFILYRHFYAYTKLSGHYTIGVILNNIELSQSDMEVVKFIIGKRLEQINQHGGVNGRELRVTYLDDKGSTETARQVVRETMDDKHLIGYIGCWSSTRSKAISELVGPARIPFIGGYALTSLFEEYPTMYTAEQGIKNVSAIFERLLSSGYQRPSFVGKKDDLYSMAMLQEMYKLERVSPFTEVVYEKWFTGDHTYTQADFDSLTQALKTKRSDFLLLSFESGTTSDIIKEIRKAGIDIPVFTALGDLGFVVHHADGRKAGELYDLNVIGIPGTFNLRLQEQIPAFSKEIRHSETLELQLSFGARLADSIGIIAEAAKSESPDASPHIRERINKGLEHYTGGGRIYRGWFYDWYFTPERSIAGDVLLAWKPVTSAHHILAPEQYMAINDTLRKVPVLYTHMDMVQLNRVSDTEGSFYATFYLEVTSLSPFSMQQLDFTNAARSETSHEYLLDIKTIRERRQHGEMNLYNYMFKISGKFLFEPDLRNYPFDRQRFSI
ncbi:MAG: ABC transporter substrate-binding protein, partial [Hymenobacteraceae bacterium]|nr:ABC transporter substrate-binding protein [Hymenobacteraceae bacterium]